MENVEDDLEDDNIRRDPTEHEEVSKNRHEECLNEESKRDWIGNPQDVPVLMQVPVEENQKHQATRESEEHWIGIPKEEAQVRDS